MFSNVKPPFGTTLFGASTTQAQPQASIFGQSSQSVAPGLGLSGQVNTVFNATSSVGTSIPFNPPISSETAQRNGQSQQVNTKHELRLEDYGLNLRPGTQQGAAIVSLFGGPTGTATNKPFGFGATSVAPTASLFGAATTTTQSGSIFGGSSLFSGVAATTQSSVFGNKPLFGSPMTSQASGTSIFGATTSPAAQTGTFGAFGQTNSVFGTKPLFGATATTSGSIFGAQTTTSPAFAFGQTQPQQPNLFGSPTASAKPNLLFGGAQANTGLGFGATGATKPPTSAATGLFGSPATSNTGFIFGAPKPAASTGLFGAAPATSTTAKPGGMFSFGPTPATSGFSGFATTISQASTGVSPFAGFAATNPAGSSLFGQQSVINNKKPLFGTGTAQPVATGCGLFGTSTISGAGGALGSTTGFGTGLFGSSAAGAQATGFGFGGPQVGQVSLSGAGLLGNTGLQNSAGFGLGMNTNPSTGGSLLGGGLKAGFGSGLTGTGLLGSTLGSGSIGGVGGSFFGSGVNQTNQNVFGTGFGVIIFLFELTIFLYILDNLIRLHYF
ncbi:unnamed protein product [Protopolystoma xenopodis]|uniref:Nuclear pore complex protein Nup98-Nup96 n=1 Tax=Protopolystoma xenopodis TaxID=117903 RepID=A0A448WRE4_9PLAT|nr:unnamed protein product [Protopolystoma xenopodis]